MTTTVNTDMVIYNDLAQTAYLERIQDVIEIFNVSSSGAVILNNELIEGDLRKRAFYKIGGAVEHRDVNSDAKVTAKKIGPGEMVGVKVPFKYGPYQTTDEAFKRRARSPEEFSMLVGQDYADAVLEGYIEYAMASLKASIMSNADMVANASIAKDGKKTLTKGMRKFGDRSARIALWVMDSTTYFDLVDQAITDKIYNEADIVIYGGQPGTLGKPVLVTDKAPVDSIFGLQTGAITVTESQLPGFCSYSINDQENIAMGFRAEGTFNLDVLGYSWKETAGVNPNLAALGSSANWTKYATSNKSTAGVLIDLSTKP
ncbi:Ig domain-containing protein [Entomomonas moraniae]|uniref:Ig domain-containing protein n=1 Tax=Entomomonas moraniae TaxID=2213226 RepID=A0A3S9XDX2_9GAMM|nr:major capsid protein [Entomomonas moraniae]AZS50652.1 Ig domain-containing protein [Entomomonas moraniae]